MNTQQLTFQHTTVRNAARTETTAKRLRSTFPLAQSVARHSEVWTVLFMLGILGYVADQTIVFASGMLHTVVANALTMYH